MEISEIQQTLAPELDETPDTREEFGEDIKKLLEKDINRKEPGNHDFLYEFEHHTENDDAVYTLQNTEELGIDDLPGMNTLEEDFTMTFNQKSGVENVGVSRNGEVTLQTQNGNPETYFLAGAYEGQAIIKDDNNITWRYQPQEQKLEYMNTRKGSWVESPGDRHIEKFNKVLTAQEQVYNLKRLENVTNSWSHSTRDKGKRDNMKTRFDIVMQGLVENEKYEDGDVKHSANNGGAKGKDIISDFKKARKRFQGYGIVKYGIDPLEDVDIASDGSTVEYQPK